MDTPNSYKDPYWATLASNTESKLGLPEGLLTSIVTKGERSNHDQVSEAGARTVFQITPSTRKLAIDKYGVDPYLNPENAAEVAGRLLKDSLDRNKGDTSLAVAEYHGGTDRANWGPRTRSYVQRVMGSQQPTPQQSQPGQSTFQRVMANQPTAPNAIAAVYDAYKSGKMSPDEAKDFEADVKSGVVMLPRGASLQGQTAPAGVEQSSATILPKSVTDAYVSGQMSEQERADLEADIKAGIVKLPPTTESKIPTNDPNWKPPTEQGILQHQPDPTLGQKIVGAGEAALTTGTGIVGGTVGMIGGGVKGIADSMINDTFGTPQGADAAEQSAMAGARALTYAPRTATGREYAQNVGEAMQQTIPIMPLTAEMGALAATTKAATPIAQATVARAAAPVVSGTQRAAEAVQNVTSNIASKVHGAEPTPTAGTMASGGAAGTDVAAMRRAAAQELPVPVQLTEGQATRDFAQQRFEQEAAKNPELGAPLRERAAEQHKAIRQSFDAWVDQTGAEAPDLRATGIAVDKALTAKAARDKAEIRVAYKEADKAGEMQAPVSTKDVVDALNDSRSAESTAPVLTAARKELIRLGGAVEDANGNLVAVGAKPKWAPEFPTLEELKSYAAPVPKDTPDYVYLTHAVRSESELRSIVENGIQPGSAGKSWLSPNGIIRDRGAGYVVVKVPRSEFEAKFKPGRDVVETGLEYPEVTTTEVVQPNQIVKVVPQISRTRADKIAQYALKNQGLKDKDVTSLPPEYASWFSATENQPRGGMSLGNMEQLRKFVNKTTGNDPTNIKFAGDVKRAIDASTEGAGGELYQKARGLRAKYADQYENHSVIADLLNNKRGTSDRRVALEDVFDRVVFRGSLDDLRTARRTLQTGGEEGKQAWKEIQGAAVRYIRDEATKGVARDSTGQEMISASGLERAIKRLDNDGKLDYLFGKRGAEQMRSVNDLAKVLFTSPPGTINTSNTASVILAALDMAVSGSAGMPLPVMSGLKIAIKHVKDRKLRVRISEALGNNPGGNKF